MLAGAFVARRRRMHCRGSDTAAELAVEREQRRRAIPRGDCQHRRRRAEADPAGAHAVERLQGQQRDGGRRAAEQVPAATPPTTTTTREAMTMSRSARDEDETESARSSAELCAVCLEDVRGAAAAAAAALLPCSHAYHPACVRPWLAVRRACPCCRAAVPPSVEASEDTA